MFRRGCNRRLAIAGDAGEGGIRGHEGVGATYSALFAYIPLMGNGAVPDTSNFTMCFFVALQIARGQHDVLNSPPARL